MVPTSVVAWECGQLPQLHVVACEALFAVWQLPKSGGSVCSELFSGAVTNLAVSAATHTAATDAVHSQQNHMLNVGCSTVQYECMYAPSGNVP
jgi:hypothetical protein